MKIWKNILFLIKLNNFWIIYGRLTNFNYWWNFGSMALNINLNQKKYFQNENIFSTILYLNNIFLIFKNVLVEIGKIMYMYKMGTLSKRYWTKKKLMLKYSGKKKHYSYNTKNNNYDDVVSNHKNQLIVSLEAKNDSNDLFLKESFLHLQQNGQIIVKEKKNMIKEINNCLEDSKEKIKIMNNIEKLELKNTKELINLYDNYNIMYKIKTHKILGVVKMNYTTDIKKNSIVLVKSNIIEQKPLNKGIGLHVQNSLFLQIRSDKDFVLVLTYIQKNFEDDLKQKILIETNSDIKNLNEIYNEQTKKILEKIGLKEIIINNKISTKQQLLQYLSENWIKIREE